jgi:hypothetical protein
MVLVSAPRVEQHAGPEMLENTSIKEIMSWLQSLDREFVPALLRSHRAIHPLHCITHFRTFVELPASERKLSEVACYFYLKMRHAPNTIYKRILV